MIFQRAFAVALLCVAACGPAATQNNSSSSLDTASDDVADAKKKITISPATVTLMPSETQQFTAKESGSSASVVWSAENGSITAQGLYTAPQDGSADTVTATLSGSSTAVEAKVTIAGSQSGATSGGSSGGSSGSSSGGSCSPDGAALQAACYGASDWGTAMNTDFGRVDGTITAIAKPTDTQCNQSNSTHFVLEVTTNGKPYPLVVNVDDSDNKPSYDVYFGETDAALVGVPWAEGWHTDSAEKLDYANDLSVHSTAFSPYSETDLVSAITCELNTGDQVSVYALGWGDNGAHDIHRNTGGGGADGAIVLHATTNPHYLMFRFVDQSF